MDASGIIVESDQAITFRLKRPDSLFPLAIGSRYASIVKNGTTDFVNPSSVVGTGPFRLKQYQKGQSWSMVANRNYWGGGPYLDGLEAVIVSDSATKVQSVVSGNAHITDTIDFSTVQQIQSSSTATLLRLKGGFQYHVAMDSTQKPFDDPRVVEAIKLAQDRKVILDTAFAGIGQLTSDTPEPSTDAFYPPSLGIRKQDIAKSKSLLAEAGYANGIDLELFTSDAQVGQVAHALAFQQVVAPAGIRVKVTKWPPATYWDQIWMKRPMFCSSFAHRHPNEILNLAYVGTAANESRFSDPRLTKLLDQGLSTGDYADQQSIYRQALQLVADGLRPSAGVTGD